MEGESHFLVQGPGSEKDMSLGCGAEVQPERPLGWVWVSLHLNGVLLPGDPGLFVRATTRLIALDRGLSLKYRSLECLRSVCQCPTRVPDIAFNKEEILNET